MNTEPDTPAAILAAAENWARRTTEGLAPGEREEFRRWMREDARHSQAFARANADGVDCDWVWQAGVVDEVLSRLAERAQRRRRGRAVAVTAVAVLVLAVGLVWRGSRPPSPPVRAGGTALVVIRPERQALPDGSVVELKEGAKVSVDFTRAVRTVTLVRGTAFFQVAKDHSRPFVVRTGALAVQAVGTAFAVDRTQREMTVLVTEGRVRVDPLPPNRAATGMTVDPLVSVGAGDSVVVRDAEVLTRPLEVRRLERSALAEQTGWRIPKLEFTATPLREIVNLMNEHNDVQLELGDDSVGQLRISGVLRADKGETLVEMLESDFGVSVEHTARGMMLRRGR